jgi:alanyl-tRNA synthetase
MTERLYYTDSYCTHFSARVIERLVWEDRPAVVLDRTAFYPTSGGQPSDRGTLDGVGVLDVFVREEDGAIVHVLEHALREAEVEGLLDWSGRFDHMQQHTGQHVLSAAFERVLDADTVGFHLGTDLSTIDLNVAHLEPAAALPVEELANQVVWENRPVAVRLVNPDDLATLPLRRPPVVEGPVRIVEIADLDVNPCGGTHVINTGEIGLIKIVRLEHRGGETRVEFVCGGRALRDYQAKNGMASRLTAMLTVGHWELDQAVERLQAEAKQLRHDLRAARRRLLRAEASELAEAAAAHGPHRVVGQVWERRDPAELRALAQELMQRPGLVALLVSVGERTHLCFARAEGMELDVAALLRDACAQLGGKGGGRPHLAQGSAPAADVAYVTAVVDSLIEASIKPARG